MDNKDFEETKILPLDLTTGFPVITYWSNMQQ